MTLGVVERSTNTLLQIYCCFERILKIAQRWQRYGGKLDFLKRPVCWDTVLLKDTRFRCAVSQAGTVKTASRYD